MEKCTHIRQITDIHTHKHTYDYFIIRTICKKYEVKVELMRIIRIMLSIQSVQLKNNKKKVNACIRRKKQVV